MAPQKDPQPMDPDAPEGPARPIQNTLRPCWAAQTLRGEIEALFPTAMEYSEPDGRNTNLCLEVVSEGYDGLPGLLDLLVHDSRVEEVVHDDGVTKIRFYSNPRTQDRRDPFGLAEAWATLHAPVGADEDSDDLAGGRAESEVLDAAAALDALGEVSS